MELAGSIGHSEVGLLEKLVRDSTILGIFEGTQQIQRIQQFISARRIFSLSSVRLT